MNRIIATVFLLLCVVSFAGGRNSGYFPLSEGSTEEVIGFFNMCLDGYRATSKENQKKVAPTTFCNCLTDAARLNLRSTGKLMPDEEKAAVCREVSRTK